MQTFKNYIFSVIFLFCLGFLWEILVRVYHIPIPLLPAPSAIITVLFSNWQPIMDHTVITLCETGIGISIAVFFALSCSLLFSFSETIRKTVYPLFLVSQTIPMIALAPLLLLWFGYDMTPKIIVVILYSFFPIVVSTTDAFMSVDRQKIALLKSMRADTRAVYTHLKIPSILPAFFSGLKIAVTYCVTGAIAGEFVGAQKGLGVYMKYATNSHAFSLLYALILVVVCLSIMLFFIVSLVEKLVIPWHFHQVRP
jgi:ABC-type nitrate/sulfonate/bicarbonate transport system permease component